MDPLKTGGQLASHASTSGFAKRFPQLCETGRDWVLYNLGGIQHFNSPYYYDSLVDYLEV
jgi:hypothetical protein